VEDLVENTRDAGASTLPSGRRDAVLYVRQEADATATIKKRRSSDRALK